MSDGWYYAQGEKPLGPFTIDQLVSILSAAPNAENILVWRANFSDWIAAGKVAQLAHIFRIETYPVPPPVPVSIKRSGEESGEKSSRSKRRDIRGSLTAMFAIAIIGGGVRYLTHNGAPTSQFDSTSVISGKSREEFVTAGMVSCMKNQESDPTNKSLSLSREALNKYCSCYMNSLADNTTFGDLKAAPKDGSVSPALQQKISAAGANCADRFRRDLLGGG
jgi:hypothetical protein